MARSGGARHQGVYPTSLEQVVKLLPMDADLDVLSSDVDPADKRHEDGSDCVWGKRRKFL